MLDLSPDERGGTEISLILFSFSKECLTWNHHRSKHTGVPCIKGLGLLWTLRVLGRARNSTTFPNQKQGAMAPSSELG